MLESDKKYQRNIPSLTLHLVFAKRITAPIMMPLYLALGFSYTQIGLFSSAAWATDASLEVFGGAFSDVYGRRKTSIIYSLLGMATMTLFALGHTFTMFILANILYGIAIAIGSGNASSLLFDTLKVLRLENQYKKYRGKIQFTPKVINGFLLLLVPILYQHQARFPFWLGLILYGFSFISALFIIEPPKKSSTPNHILPTIKNAWREMRANPAILATLLREMLFTGFVLLVAEYYQPLLKIVGIPLALTGLIYALARVLEGLGSLWLHKLECYSDRHLVKANILLILAILIGFGFTKSYWLFFLILLNPILDGASDVLMGDILNKQISSDNRTTIQSTGNLISGFFLSGLLLVGGYTSDHIGVQPMFLVMVAIFTISTWMITTICRKGSADDPQSPRVAA